MQSALRHKGFTHPVIYLKGTKTVIDGHHRIEAHKRLRKLGQKVKLPTKQQEHDDPQQLSRDLNSVRRSWNDTEQRRTEAQFLASKNFSTHTIAKTLGVNHSTVVRDLSRSGADAPDRETVETRIVQLSNGKSRKVLGDADREICHDMREAGSTFQEISDHFEIPNQTISDICRKPRPSTQKLSDFAQQRGTQWQQEADERIREIQLGEHPESFKKAVKHFNNFDKLVQSAFDAKDSNGWDRYHWNFVKTEVNSIISIILQCAEERNQAFNEDYVGTAAWRALEQRRSGTSGFLPIPDNGGSNSSCLQGS